MLTVEGMSNQWQTDMSKTNSGWESKRFGASPPAALVQQAQLASNEIYAACGLSGVPFSERGDGAGRREAFRQALHSVVSPLGRIMQAELRWKLDSPGLMLNFDALFASDLSGRARAFSTAAWNLAPRDNFIGWTRQLREKNLPFVVDNPRFLILPWINIPNLGSHILAIIRRRLPDDWTERYNTTPVLIETFVETPRYTCAVYRASGWTRVGTTQGRGRYDRDRQSDKPKKDVWLRPLRRDWKRTLNR